jgi:hypothetical protein
MGDRAELLTPFAFHRLRQVDVKAEHFERQVSRVEAERDSWEKKFEEAQEKYNASKRELDEVRFEARLSPSPPMDRSLTLPPLAYTRSSSRWSRSNRRYHQLSLRPLFVFSRSLSFAWEEKGWERSREGSRRHLSFLLEREGDYQSVMSRYTTSPLVFELAALDFEEQLLSRSLGSARRLRLGTRYRVYASELRKMVSRER